MRRIVTLAVLAAAIIGCSAPPPASPSPIVASEPPDASAPAASATATPLPLTASALSQLLDPNELSRHLAAFQDIADESDGNRATGTAGFEASVGYVESELRAAGYEVERLSFDAGGAESWNLVAERAGSGPGVVMVGAHADSVAVSPGINDNASGVSALLAIATALAELPDPVATVRFAFWGAEEGGPFGSQAYVDALDEAAIAEIRAYLNVDMIGSPNGLTFIYDEPGAADGSEAITNIISGYFRQRGRPWEPIDLAGDSDHGGFTTAGIPTGGLFAGGIEPVTGAQAAAHGATAGVPADACSHAACDTLDNVNLARLALMTDALAAAIVALAADAAG